MWTALRIRWLTISATSTRWDTRQPIQPWMGRSIRFVWSPLVQAVRWSAPGRAITPRPKWRVRNQAASDVSGGLAHGPRLPVEAMAQSLPALAHRDLFRHP